MTPKQKYQSLKAILSGLERVVIAYSGGVDSTFLLKTAVDTLGKDNVLPCIAVGPSLPQSQYKQAIQTAKDIGVQVREVLPDEMSDPAYRANDGERCYHCKWHLFEILSKLARENNFKCVICGHNVDDNSDYRPGTKAAESFDVQCPLSQAGLTKEDVRTLSRQLNLPTADMPASPCLASRICYGLEITQERLRQVEQAEEFLKTLGLVEFRVRHHDTTARIEVHAKDIEKITSEPARSQIIAQIKSLGFKYVTVDLQGFRSGSLNELLGRGRRQ